MILEEDDEVRLAAISAVLKRAQKIAEEKQQSLANRVAKAVLG